MTDSATRLTASSMTTGAALRLPDLVGAEHVLVGPALCAPYEVDGCQPAAVLRPGSAEEIAEILRFAAGERLAVIPMGGRTKVAMGMPPQRFDVALDLSRMSRVLAYDPRDLTCGVEAGVRFADLAGLLAGERQFLPLAPAFAARATLGGIVAAGADSPLRHAYGSARDYLLGVEFITGDAVPSKSGGRVVKNVTGYDLHKLLIGSLGTLAVITRLNFRTFPLPPEQGTFVASFSSADAALGWCAAIAKSPLEPRMVEVLDSGTARLFAQSYRGLAAEGWCVVVNVAGHRAVVERHARDLGRLAGEKKAREFVSVDAAEQGALFRCISEFPSLVLENFPDAAIFRMAVLPSAMPELLRRVGELLERVPVDTNGEGQTTARNALNRATLVRASGVVYVALLPANDGAHADGAGGSSAGVTSADRAHGAHGEHGVHVAHEATRTGDGGEAHLHLLQACRDLMDVGVAMGVRPVIERCSLAVKRALAAEGRSIWPPPGAEHVLAERLKKVFDPHGILAPGRFQGGI